MSNTNETLECLIDRVTRLEGQNKRTRAAAWLLGTALLLVVSLGAVHKQSSEDVVQAKSFQIVDDNGNVRGAFEVMEYGNARLSLQDEDNITGVYLDANIYSGTGPHFRMYGEQGSIAASINHMYESSSGFFLDHMGPCIDLSDELGNMKVTLGYSKETGPWFEWLDERGDIVYSASPD